MFVKTAMILKWVRKRVVLIGIIPEEIVVAGVLRRGYA